MRSLALGHEDLNDHEELRHDPALQTEACRVTFHSAIIRRPRLPRVILDNSSCSSAVSFNTCLTDIRAS